MALYPDVSPTEPVTRDDLARIMLLQQMQGTSAGDKAVSGTTAAQGTQSFGDMLGGSGRGYESGAPGTGMGIGRDAAVSGRDAISASLADPGALTTANAAMAISPNSTSWDTVNTNRDTINPFSEDSLSGRADKAFSDTALASPAYSGGYNPGGAFTGRGGGKEGYGETDTAIAAPADNTVTTTAIAPTGMPSYGWGGGRGRDSAAMNTPNPLSDAPGYNPDYDAQGIIDSIMGNVALADQALAAQTGAAVPGGGGARGGAVTGGGAVASPGNPGSPGYDAATAGVIGSIMGNVGPIGGATSGGGFSATGGYEGSASMSNTGGAQGFGGGLGAEGGAAAGAGDGAGAVGGFGGGGTDPGGSPGGVG